MPDRTAPPSPTVDYGAVLRQVRDTCGWLEFAIDRARVGADITQSRRDIARAFRRAADALDPSA
jgi:hypothetical protein